MPPDGIAAGARQACKQTMRKDQIAAGAAAALHELGYARTSLRDVAASADLSLGMVHYYFEDRADLIVYCVRRYKDAFIQDLRRVLEPDAPPSTKAARLAEALTSAVIENWQRHTLWYDIRAQALFDSRFREAVAQIETELKDLVRNILSPPTAVDATVTVLYAQLDGVFGHFVACLASGKQVPRGQIIGAFELCLRPFSEGARG